MGIGKRIKEARENLNLTQKELGKLVGVTGSAITNYENETSHPKEPVMYALLNVLKVDANYLFQDSFDFISSNFKCSLKEQKHIEAYRTLDPHGKELIDYTLNHEYTRCTTPQQPDTIEENITPYDVLPFSLSEYKASAGRGAYLGPEAFTTIMVEKNDLTKRALFGVPVSGDSMEPTYYDGDVLIVERADEIKTGEIGIFTLDGEGYVKICGDGELISLNESYVPMPMNESISLNGRVIGILEKKWVVE